MNEQNIKKRNINFLINFSVEIIEWAIREYGCGAFCTTAFGANGVVLIDLVRRSNKDMPFYFINTGQHFEETISVKNEYAERGINIIELRSTLDEDIDVLHEMGPDMCCRINKVEPLQELLKSEKRSLWITAISRVQTGVRRGIEIVEKYNELTLKCHPMLFWKEEDVWSYIRMNNIPYNKLYDKGYKSIGCKPCTTPVREGEDSRAGRWRGLDKDECGLHIK